MIEIIFIYSGVCVFGSRYDLTNACSTHLSCVSFSIHAESSQLFSCTADTGYLEHVTLISEMSYWLSAHARGGAGERGREGWGLGGLLGFHEGARERRRRRERLETAALAWVKKERKEERWRNKRVWFRLRPSRSSSPRLIAEFSSSDTKTGFFFYIDLYLYIDIYTE